MVADKCLKKFSLESPSTSQPAYYAPCGSICVTLTDIMACKSWKSIQRAPYNDLKVNDRRPRVLGTKLRRAICQRVLVSVRLARSNIHFNGHLRRDIAHSSPCYDCAVSTKAASMDSVFPEARKVLAEADPEVARLVEEEKRRQWCAYSSPGVFTLGAVSVAL